MFMKVLLLCSLAGGIGVMLPRREVEKGDRGKKDASRRG
jgi:hypothetical protein